MSSKTARLMAVFVAGLVPFVVGLRVHGQGFNLMDDGLWLLGTRVLADGGHLYRDIFQIYGPARNLLLAPFFMIFGQSVFALVILKAVLDGLAGALGYLITRRLGARWWAWLVPLGVLALSPVYPRYVAAGLFAALVSGAVWNLGAKRRGWVLGVAWGGLTLFGLDMFAYGAFCLVGTALLRSRDHDSKFSKLMCFELTGGFLLVLLPTALIAFAGGYFSTMWWDTVVYPVTRFGGEMGRSWLTVFGSSAHVSQPFSGLHTGEILEAAWPGHAAWVALAWRCLYALAWLSPLAAVWVMWRRGWTHLTPFAFIAWASWSTLLGRGDLDHLRLVSWLLLLLWPPLLARLCQARAWQVAVAVVCVVVLGPRFGERLWLAGNGERSGLSQWERDTTGIKISDARRHDLERVLQATQWDGQAPVVAWPAQPGLVFALAAPLATPQMTLLAGEVRDADSIVRGLQSGAPPVVILGRSAGLVEAVRGMRTLAPTIYAHLRHEFALVANVKGSEAVFRVLQPSPDGAQGLPLSQRLPGDSQYLRTGTTPIMGPGTSVAQTVQVTDFDLSGIAFLMGSPGPWPQTINIQLQIVSVTNGAGGQLLRQIPLQIELNSQVERVELAFDSVPATREQTVIVEVLGNRDNESPFTLFWHTSDPDDPNPVDYYP
ncbi:MAG: hypothetical protein ACI9UK_002538, partial [Candidatus Krumholzibacteriia bacterium]